MSTEAFRAAIVGALVGALFWHFVWAALLRPLAEFRAVLEIARCRRQARRQVEEHAKRIAGLKARIVAVGDLSVVNGIVHLGEGWEFDLSNGTPVHSVDDQGQYRYAGYSHTELIKIWKRRDEFAPKRHD